MVDRLSSDPPDRPALSNEDLCETLDLFSTVMASVSDRVDAHTQVLDRLNKTATEARQAAFAAKAQTDPERYGELIADKLDSELRDRFRGLDHLTSNLGIQTNRTEHVLKQMKDDRSALYVHLRSKEKKAERLQRRLPWFGLGAVVAAVALSVILPRFYASYGTTCTAIGAEWTQTTDGVRACVFYVE